MIIVSDCFNFVTTVKLYQFKNYTVCLSHRDGAKILVRGEAEHRTNFIHEFLSSSVLQWRSQNLGSGKTLCIHQRLLKNFGKLIKTLAQKFKKFSKIFQK